MNNIEYLEYLKDMYRVLANSLCDYRHFARDFEEWKEKLIETHEYLRGRKPRIEGDYWMVDDDTGYDLRLMYEQGINTPTKIDKAQ